MLTITRLAGEEHPHFDFGAFPERVASAELELYQSRFSE
jgi:hypothetical protein